MFQLGQGGRSGERALIWNCVGQECREKQKLAGRTKENEHDSGIIAMPLEILLIFCAAIPRKSLQLCCNQDFTSVDKLPL